MGNIYDSSKVEVVIRFKPFLYKQETKARIMYHCHLPAHADLGMMLMVGLESDPMITNTEENGDDEASSGNLVHFFPFWLNLFLIFGVIFVRS